MCEDDELLYTQGDIDKWMRTCENLQEHIKEQEEELAEKNKEIEKLNLMIKTLPNHDTEIEQEVRKQVCDELRDYFGRFTPIFIQVKTDVLDKLDQIEKGEQI